MQHQHPPAEDENSLLLWRYIEDLKRDGVCCAAPVAASAHGSAPILHSSPCDGELSDLLPIAAAVYANRRWEVAGSPDTARASLLHLIAAGEHRRWWPFASHPRRAMVVSLRPEATVVAAPQRARVGYKRSLSLAAAVLALLAAALAGALEVWGRAPAADTACGMPAITRKAPQSTGQSAKPHPPAGVSASHCGGVL